MRVQEGEWWLGWVKESNNYALNLWVCSMLSWSIENGGAIYECEDVSHIERPPRDQQGPGALWGTM